MKREDIDLSWLVQSRWGMVVAFLVALVLSELGAVQRMDAPPVLAGASITILTNLVAPIARNYMGMGRLTVGLLVFDILVLTVVLYVTGGAANPLSALYLMPIALAAVMLPTRFAWILAGLTASMFFLLFFSPESHRHQAKMVGAEAHNAQEHEDHDPLHHHAGSAIIAPPPIATNIFDLHLRGMWMAFTLTAVSMAYFVTRVSQALRKRDAQLEEARTRAFRAERVASLASLAASTAHELGTPLASIGLAASEMRRAIASSKPPSVLLADTDLVAAEVRRCREIIDAMLGAAGETIGEPPVHIDAMDLVRDAVSSLSRDEAGRVVLPQSPPKLSMHAPRRIVAQTLQNLLRNALDASSEEQSIEVSYRQLEDRAVFAIIDHGVGMNDKTCAEAFEPFVSTKSGRGRGMGLFFVNSVATRLGGEVRLESEAGKGTRAILEVPIETVTPASRDDSPQDRETQDA